MADYRKIIEIKQETADFYNSILSMSAEELYSKHGIKRNEFVDGVEAQFDNGYRMTIDIRTDSEGTAYVDYELMDGDIAIDSNTDDTFIGDYWTEWEANDYYVDVVVKKEI